ncbi:restriction endonuclease subunit S [Acidovorax sp. Q11]
MSFPRYPEYKDSGDAALGQIPSHWRVARIGDVAKVVNGYPFDSALFNDDGAYPLIRIRDLGVSETATRYSGDFVETAAVTSSDVLIGMDGDFNVGRWLGTGAALLNQRMCCIRTPSPVLTKLLEYALPQPLRVINDLTYATTVKHLSSSQIEKIRVALTLDRDELRAIVKFLDRETAKIDALVAEQEKLIALLQEKRQAVISHAVTKGLDPNVPMKDSGVDWLGEVPEHWSVGKCGFYMRILSGFPFPSSGFTDDDSNHRLLRGANVGVSRLKWDDTVYWQRLEGDGFDEYEMSEGDLVIGMDRPLIGEGMRVAKVTAEDLPSLLLQRVASLKVGDKLKADYLHYLLSSEMFVAHFSPETTGVSVPHISPDQINKFIIPIPPISEQIAIVNEMKMRLAQFGELIAESEIAVSLLQERRTALISAAVTGQIDVRGLAPLETA